MRARLAGIVAVALALVPLAAAADDREDALKLAQRAGSMEGLLPVVVTLHAAPASLPASVPLPKATLLGSLASSSPPRERAVGRSATMVSYASRPIELFYDAPNRDATVKTYEDALRGAGWKHVDFASHLPFARGGFAQDLPQFDAWCSPGTPANAITIGTPKYDLTALDVRVSLGAGPRGGLCGTEGRDPASMFMETFRKASPLPTFAATSGVAIDNAGPASDGSTTGARITSSLGLPAVFESFAKQLREAGWAPKTNAGTSDIRSQTFAKTVDGKPYVALLTIYPLDATHYVAIADVSSSAE